MVRVGFIVEGDSEKIVIESPKFKSFLDDNGIELIFPVVNAKGGGNLLPQNIDVYIERLEATGVDKIYVLTDLEEEQSVDLVRDRIKHNKVETIFIAVKALEAWFLSDSVAIGKWLGVEYSEIEPEKTEGKPWDRLKELAKDLGIRGPGSKTIFAKKMVKNYGFEIADAAEHPNCPSAKELINYFKSDV